MSDRSDMTKEYAVRMHRKMWHWIAEQYRDDTDNVYLHYHVNFDNLMIKAITDPIREHLYLQRLQLNHPTGSALGDAKQEGAVRAFKYMDEWISKNTKIGSDA